MTKKTIFYIKEGRRYKPVYEYDQTLMDSFPKGTHLVQCYPGGQSRRFNIDPAYAPMIAAGRVAEDVISKALMKASDLRPKRAPITEGQRQAWENLVKEFGEDARCLEWPSAREACEEAVKAMSIEAEKLLSNPSVRKAYERFLLICELTKDHNERTE
jgi:hypothetical protein